MFLFSVLCTADLVRMSYCTARTQVVMIWVGSWVCGWGGDLNQCSSFVIFFLQNYQGAV